MFVISFFHSNLNGLTTHNFNSLTTTHNFNKPCHYKRMIVQNNFDVICVSKVFLNSSFENDDE